MRQGLEFSIGIDGWRFGVIGGRVWVGPRLRLGPVIVRTFIVGCVKIKRFIEVLIQIVFERFV